MPEKKKTPPLSVYIFTPCVSSPFLSFVLLHPFLHESVFLSVNHLSTYVESFCEVETLTSIAQTALNEILTTGKKKARERRGHKEDEK